MKLAKMSKSSGNFLTLTDLTNPMNNRRAFLWHWHGKVDNKTYTKELLIPAEIELDNGEVVGWEDLIPHNCIFNLNQK